MTTKGIARQAVFDAIKKIREGETVPVTIDEVTLPVGPNRRGPGPGECYNAVVLCRLRGRMRFAHVSYKDAGPNPQLYDGNFFVRARDIYGTVEAPLGDALRAMQ